MYSLLEAQIHHYDALLKEYFAFQEILHFVKKVTFFWFFSVHFNLYVPAWFITDFSGFFYVARKSLARSNMCWWYSVFQWFFKSLSFSSSLENFVSGWVTNVFSFMPPWWPPVRAEAKNGQILQNRPFVEGDKTNQVLYFSKCSFFTNRFSGIPPLKWEEYGYLYPPGGS